MVVHILILIRKKRATINLKNDDDRCFQYASIVFDDEEIGKNS